VALAALVLGEPVSRLRWAAAGIGFCGALIIAQPGSAALGWAAVFPLGGALAFAAFNITTRYLGTNDPPLTTFFYTGMVGALVASLAVPFVWTTPALADLLLLGLMALLGAAGQGMLIVALRFAAASTLAPFLYVQLIWAAALGLLVFGDWPALTTVLGAAVIVAAGLVAQSRVASGSRPG
ncbi:MAG: DMT family transporter, partial [Pseudomonadota bacterium]